VHERTCQCPADAYVEGYNDNCYPKIFGCIDQSKTNGKCLKCNETMGILIGENDVDGTKCYKNIDKCIKYVSSTECFKCKDGLTKNKAGDSCITATNVVNVSDNKNMMMVLIIAAVIVFAILIITIVCCYYRYKKRRAKVIFAGNPGFNNPN